MEDWQNRGTSSLNFVTDLSTPLEEILLEKAVLGNQSSIIDTVGVHIFVSRGWFWLFEQKVKYFFELDVNCLTEKRIGFGEPGILTQLRNIPQNSLGVPVGTLIGVRHDLCESRTVSGGDDFGRYFWWFPDWIHPRLVCGKLLSGETCHGTTTTKKVSPTKQRGRKRRGGFFTAFRCHVGGLDAERRTSVLVG